MAAPLSPVAIVHALLRNAVPLCGILFFGWSAANVLILYFVDTLLAMAVVFAGLMRHFLPPPRDEGWAARVNAEAGYVGAALLIVAVFAIPLGVPLIFMLIDSDVNWRTLLTDSGFRTGLALQGIAALLSCRDLYVALQNHTPEELRLKRHFALVFLRWLVMIMITYTGFTFVLGGMAPLFFVAVYTAATVWIEVAPDRFLKAMPAMAAEADTPVGDQAPLSPERKRRRARR